MVSFLTYLIILTPDKTLLIFWLSLTYPFHVYNQSQNSNKINGSIHIWVTAHLGEISKHLTWHLPQVFAYYLLLTIISLHFYRHYTMTEYAFFTEKADRWEKDMASLWGTSTSAPNSTS